MHCILAQILLTSPQTVRSIIGFAFAGKLTFEILYSHVFVVLVKFCLEKAEWSITLLVSRLHEGPLHASKSVTD